MRDIQLALELWGRWSRQRLETDYSPIAAGFKGLIIEKCGYDICSDNDAMIIDSCVARLKQKKIHEYEILVDHYIKGCSKRKISRKNKCDEKIIRIKLQMAEGFIDGCLSMLNFKLEMQG
ncbi:antiterminator Q family protein [Acerihabitans sp. TG2]|uniref:antiterminator Q family protein n=1 Tax=Acerihabitans sp. TG2 TaxID=3096008 RepID=UPI002B23482B|nr:antiterminator Q family protein [Acerihabitans sp. TG2]MEA9393138.1 antiterminator Q family protein [Acerihabitans sp. TG2]